jgi:DedD protein
MSDPRTEQQSSQDETEESDFGSRLKVRLAIAGGLVALALAAIPILDNLTGKKTETNEAGSTIATVDSSAAMASAPVAAASAPVAAASATASSQPAAGTSPAGPDISQTPGMMAAPALSLPPGAPPAAGPAKQAAHPSATKPRQTVQPVVAATPSTRQAQPAPYAAAPAAAPAPYAARPAPQAVQPLPPQAFASQPARPAGTSVGYNVQLGLFDNMDNAQKLIAELKSKGINAVSETRVHLAPFRTRAEAEQAIAKLRALGYAPLLNTPGS